MCAELRQSLLTADEESRLFSESEEVDFFIEQMVQSKQIEKVSYDTYRTI
jgi:hypothetical protein